MSTIASQTTSLTIVYSTIYSGADQSKHQSSASLAFVWGIHRGPVNSPHKWPVTRKKFPFDDVIMYMGVLLHHAFSQNECSCCLVFAIETTYIWKYRFWSEVTVSLPYSNSSNFASNPSPWTHSDNDVMTWKPFPHYYPHARGIHWSPVNSFHKELPCGALIFSSLYAQTRFEQIVELLVIWNTMTLM